MPFLARDDRHCAKRRTLAGASDALDRNDAVRAGEDQAPGRFLARVQRESALSHQARLGRGLQSFAGCLRAVDDAVAFAAAGLDKV
jgi:hypothetical protein